MLIFMSTPLQELRHSARTLRRSPGFTALAVITLALGIGANSAIFTLVNAIVLQPLPHPDADRLVVVKHAAPGLGLTEAELSDGTFYHYRDHNRVFDGIGMYNENVVNLSGGASPERVQVALVTPNLFSILGAQPALGRLLAEADNTPYNPDVLTPVVLSHGLWTRQYGADPGIIGRTIELNSAPKQVVGIMEPGFDFPRPETEIWYPQGLDPAAAGLGGFYFHGVARLQPGVSPLAAQADLQRLIPGLADVYPGAAAEIVERGGLRAVVDPLKAEVVRDVGSALWILLGGVGLVLLIACANIGNLVLVRAEHRQKELAVRTALGAGRRELVRYFLTESTLLSAVGAALGLAMAWGAIHVLRVLGPTNLPRLHEVGLDAWVVGFTGGLAVFVALVFGAIPVLRFGRSDLAAALNEGSGRATAGRERKQSQSILVAVQVALGLTLLIASALMVQSLWRLRHVDPGFRSEGVLTLEIAMAYGPYPDYASQARYWYQLLERVRAFAGVQAAGAVTGIPLVPLEAYYDGPIISERQGVGRGDATSQTRMRVDAADPQAGADEAAAQALGAAAPVVTFMTVTPGYFEAMQIPLIRGRGFQPGDRAGAERPVLVSAALAQRLFSAGNAIGRRVRRGDGPDQPWLTITGVVGDVPQESVAGEPAELVYSPVMDGAADYSYPGHMTLAIRTSLPPLSLVPAVRRNVLTLDPNMPIANVRTMERIVADSMARTSFTMLLLLIAAAVALFLGAVGLYGVISYTVGRRTREIGVRIALGAQPARIGRMVLAQAAGVALAGLVVGMLLALALTRVLRSLLFEVSPTDPGTYAGAALLLLALALLASYLPSRRAARVDPLETLRQE